MKSVRLQSILKSIRIPFCESAFFLFFVIFSNLLYFLDSKYKWYHAVYLEQASDYQWSQGEEQYMSKGVGGTNYLL